MKFRLLTVVWGPEFVDRFFRFALRTLLAPQNLPALAARHEVVWTFYTTPEDAARVREDPALRQLPKSVDFQIRLFRPKEIDEANSSSHWILWRRGIAEARGADECVITVAADHIFAEDTLARWAALFEAGKLAIFSPGIQVALETVTDELSSGSGPVALPAQELLKLMFRHLHPVNITMFRDSPRWMMHPEYLLQALPGAGFAQTILTSHAVAFRPAKIRITKTFCPVEKLDDIAYEPCRFLSAEPLLKNLSLYYRAWRMDDVTLSHYGYWGALYFQPSNVRESAQQHIYAIGRSPTEHEIARARAASRFYVTQMQTSRLIYGLWQRLRAEGAYRAARLVAAGAILARLRRRIVARGPMSVFVPSDSVLVRLEPGEYARLLEGDGGRLVAALRAHLAPGRHRLRAGDRLAAAPGGEIRTLAGARYGRDPNGSIRIQKGPLGFEGFEIYFVSELLTPVAMKPAASADFMRNALLHARRGTRRVIGGVRSLALHLSEISPAAARLVRHCRALWRGGWRHVPASSGRGNGEARALLARAYRLRSIDVLRDMFEHYERAVLKGTGLRSAPRLRLPSVDGRAEILQTLSEAVALDPDFSDAWLELGYTHRDAGNEPAALAAFMRSANTTPMLLRGSGDPDPRLRAAIAAAQMLDRAGKRTEALAALEAAPSVPPVPWRAHHLKARLKLSLGSAEAALPELESCMKSDDVAPVEGKLIPVSLELAK